MSTHRCFASGSAGGLDPSSAFAPEIGEQLLAGSPLRDTLPLDLIAQIVTSASFGLAVMDLVGADIDIDGMTALVNSALELLVSPRPARRVESPEISTRTCSGSTFRNGMDTGRLVFSRDATGATTGLHFDGLFLSAEKRPIRKTQGGWPPVWVPRWLRARGDRRAPAAD